jgi:hypothetical protein
VVELVDLAHQLAGDSEVMAGRAVWVGLILLEGLHAFTILMLPVQTHPDQELAAAPAVSAQSCTMQRQFDLFLLVKLKGCAAEYVESVFALFLVKGSLLQYFLYLYKAFS